jgi:rSAM/selenodomain-associated transferase 1
MAEPPIVDCLCIFTRTPALGRVKTRLAESLGREGALAAHQELLEGTLQRCVSGADYAVQLWTTSDDSGVLEPLARRFGLDLRTQQGDDLGSRMNHALVTALAQFSKAVLIGTDCPDLDRNYLDGAFAALDVADLVIGPAEDGGYGLIGLKHPAPELFTGIRWGASTVLSSTLDRARVLGLASRLLKPIYDVDTLADWQRYRRSRKETN